MGFDGKTPKPGRPIHPNIIHKHKYFDHNKNKWVTINCYCATGTSHVTPKD